MVNVDNVYQKVLALANKEQRGYITPQEFNLLADKAQLEIINDYFHKIKTAHAKPKNQTESSDEIEMVREKMNFLRNYKTRQVVLQDDNLRWRCNLDQADIYMVANIRTGHRDGMPGTLITEVDNDEMMLMLGNPLLYPSPTRPVYVRQANWFNTDLTNTGHHVDIDIFPANIDFGCIETGTGEDLTTTCSITIEYWKKPDAPNWGYVVVNEKTLYNFATSKNFMLHPTEEEPLVMRILQLAGITIEKPQLQQSVMVDQQSTKQNQNS